MLLYIFVVNIDVVVVNDVAVFVVVFVVVIVVVFVVVFDVVVVVDDDNGLIKKRVS